MTKPPRQPPRGPARPAAKPAPKAANYSTATSSGVEPNLAAALSYILGLITGILFLVLERQNRFVRFHAAQSIAASLLLILISAAVSVLSRIVVFLPFLGGVVVLLLTVGLAFATFVMWLVLMWKAYQGQEWELPVAGGIAKKLV